jgi:hypothetical protein
MQRTVELRSARRLVASEIRGIDVHFERAFWSLAGLIDRERCAVVFMRTVSPIGRSLANSIGKSTTIFGHPLEMSFLMAVTKS